MVRKQRGSIDVESARHPFMACELDMIVNTINFMQNNRCPAMAAR